METKVFREKVMVWLDALVPLTSLTALLILDEGAVDHSCYIKNILPVALKYVNGVFGDKWIFQQDSANKSTPRPFKRRMVSR